MKPLTSIAHDKISSVSLTGGVAIDATVGNGHDTCFLAQQVGESGHVYGFDVQPPAIEATKTRLGTDAGRVTLLLDDHANIVKHLLPSHLGRIGAIMFNLGYLPGGHVEIITKPANTCAAIVAGIRNLKSGGIMTVLSYRGHEGGIDEFQAVSHLLEHSPISEMEIEVIGDVSATDNTPVLFVVRKF